MNNLHGKIQDGNRLELYENSIKVADVLVKILSREYKYIQLVFYLDCIHHTKQFSSIESLECYLCDNGYQIV